MKRISFLSFLFCSIFVLIVTMITKDVPYIFFYFISFLFGLSSILGFCRKLPKNELKNIIYSFIIIFSFYSVIALILNFERLYLAQIGKALAAAGNENTFFYLGVYVAEKIAENVPITKIFSEVIALPNSRLIMIREPAYPTLIGFIQLISYRIFGQYSFMSFISLNILIGSLIPVVSYLIGRVHFRGDITKSKKALFITAIFPLFIFYSCVGLRDIIITLLTILLFYFFLPSKKITIKSLINTFIIFQLLLLFRFETAIAVLGLSLCCRMVFINWGRALIYLVVIIGIVIAFLFGNPQYIDKISRIGDAQEFYQGLTLARNDAENSLGRSLATAFLPIKIIYNYFSPLPIMILTANSLALIIYSLGAIFLFYISFFYVWSIFAYRKIIDQFFNPLVLFYMLLFLLVSLTSGEFRHKLPGLPLFFIGFIPFIEAKYINRYNIFLALISFFVILLYITLKWLL